MTVKYITNKKGYKTAVVIPIKDWLAFKKEHKELIQTHKQSGKPGKNSRKRKSEPESIRNFVSNSNAFSFWERNEEDIYQDYLNKK